MHDKVVFHLIKGEQLTRSHKHGALQVIILLKQNRFGKIKGQAVTDQQKQIEVSKKSDATSPKAETELVLITSVIEAAEGRHVAVIDAPRAFLKADMDKEVIVILEKEMVDPMLEIYKEIYGKYVIYRRNGGNTCTFASARRCMER